MPGNSLKHLIFITSGCLSVDYSVGNKCLATAESFKKSFYESVSLHTLTPHFISVTYLRHHDVCQI